MEAQKSWMQQLIIFAFIFLWCSDRSFALPIDVTSVEPTKELIDNFALEDARVSQRIAFRNDKGVIVNKQREGILN